MKAIKLIQIGDIHYPDVNRAPMLDHKDLGVSPSLIKAISPNKVQNVAKYLLGIVEKGDVTGFLICGDLTSRGLVQGYEDCLKYLDDVLELRDTVKVPYDSLHVVPGNHDIDRKNCAPNTSDLYLKFEPFVKLWDSLNKRLLTTHGTRHTSLSTTGGKVALFSLNSCIGCGEMRFPNPKLQNKLREVFADVVEEHGWDTAFATLGEQLDTPAFEEEDLYSLISMIEGLDSLTLPVVLAHHNVLPQTVPRIEIYTEVINGGLVRSRLMNCSKPVIYCHGHIHSDPVEVIRSPRHKQGLLISVSAPQLDAGFNSIDIWFGQQKVPIGCTITSHRTREDGIVAIDTTKTVRIPLRRTSDYLNYGHTRMAEFLKCIAPGNFTRSKDILLNVQTQCGSGIHLQTLADVLQEAEWFQLVEILDVESEPKHWQVKKLVP